MKTIKCFLIFAGVTNAVNNYDTIDLTSLQLADNVRENPVYGEYVDLLVGRFDNRVNTTDQVETSEDVYVAIKIRVSYMRIYKSELNKMGINYDPKFPYGIWVS